MPDERIQIQRELGFPLGGWLTLENHIASTPPGHLVLNIISSPRALGFRRKPKGCELSILGVNLLSQRVVGGGDGTELRAQDLASWL